VKEEVKEEVREMRRKGKRVRCPFCGYEWYARVENPKECPLCKRYLIPPKSKSSTNAGRSKKRKRR